MYHIFHTPSSSEKDNWTDEDQKSFESRAAVVSSFLQGRSTHTVADIVNLWIGHPYGTKEKDSEEMFSLASTRHYTTVRAVRPALTSFAVQVVQKQLRNQMREAVKPASGLHTFQPLLWGLLYDVASPGSHVERKNRPVETVTSTVISKLAFSHSENARLGPLQEGLFNFATNASHEKFQYDSHVGNTPSYPTVLKAMLGLSEKSAVVCRELGLDPGFWYFLSLDNVQNYIRRRTHRLGRENWMNLGMAGTMWVRTFKANFDAFDYEAKQKLIAACKLGEITTGKLLRLIDFDHEKRVFSYQWLWVLGQYDEKYSAHLKTRANELLRTTGQRQKLPDEPTLCLPLPTTSGSETRLEELLTLLLDFWKSSGQTADHFLKRMLPVQGDGLTFELLLKMMHHRQFHQSPFDSLKIMEPVLAPWHTMWTNDAHIVEKHIVDYASLDPSTLGNSASKIKRKLIKEQGKYNYHDTTDLMYLVADMRMLDCWRLLLTKVACEHSIDTSDCDDVFAVIEKLVDASKMPTTQEFENYATVLHEMYTTEKAIHCAAHGQEDFRIPCIPADSTVDACFNTASQPSPITGNNVLAQSKDLMRETIRSRELVWSIAEGDVGRAWEQLKTIMFSMSGSSHKKYAYYLLVFVIDLHFQSTPENREAVLSMLVASLTGMPGTHRPVDLLQEWLQRTLEAIVQHKGQEFGASFIRNHVARNLRELCVLKEEHLSAVGLAKQSKRRTKISADAEC
ncbi:hypothetical protein F5878DRAFT_543819 [Lentinula raphanica]|uniref:DUF6589 domain-containing protein n=1 Tax=Lentinula raphanica TaxID=153919 RepID=A0AA38UEH3_9AGAR|nr:hypothetical protein F5878DRAFT_543819 [Lentinula raphanica]